jgi:anthranilate phosphoribosyltransferase
MKKILNFLFEHQILTRQEAKQILLDIGKGVYNEHELSAFMTVYLMRTISIDELLGFRDALLELCVPIDFEERKVIDIVGTGGDGKNTFNISTLSCFVVAGAGQPVAKHGSYGASSVSGASNLMNSIGYEFKNDQAAFHPALKVVAPIRKNIGIRTFFNMLGPMVNPSNPSYQLVGVYSLEMARIYNYLLQKESHVYTIIHALDGYDEISLTSDTKVITRKGEQIWTPEQLGSSPIDQREIFGGDTVEEASKVFMNILSGEGTKAQQDVVLANAAMALNMTEAYTDYKSALESAKESLESGKALKVLKTLIDLQKN